MKKNISPPNTERGQSLVELAVSLVIMLMLLTGAVEFGLALFQYVAIRDAAQEAAVYASVYPADVTGIKWHAVKSADDVVEVSYDRVKVFINGAEVTTNNESPSVMCENGNSITVEVTFDHPITYPFVADMIGDPVINLGASVTNTILSPRCQ